MFKSMVVSSSSNSSLIGGVEYFVQGGVTLAIFFSILFLLLLSVETEPIKSSNFVYLCFCNLSAHICSKWNISNITEMRHPKILTRTPCFWPNPNLILRKSFWNWAIFILLFKKCHIWLHLSLSPPIVLLDTRYLVRVNPKIKVAGVKSDDVTIARAPFPSLVDCQKVGRQNIGTCSRTYLRGSKSQEASHT